MDMDAHGIHGLAGQSSLGYSEIWTSIHGHGWWWTRHHVHEHPKKLSMYGLSIHRVCRCHGMVSDCMVRYNYLNGEIIENNAIGTKKNETNVIFSALIVPK